MAKHPFASCIGHQSKINEFHFDFFIEKLFDQTLYVLRKFPASEF